MKSTFNFRLLATFCAVLIVVACKKQVEQPVGNLVVHPIERVSMANSGKPSGYVGSTSLGDSLSKFRNYTGTTGTSDSVRTR